MRTVEVSPTTYQWLQRTAQESAQTPDQVADALLRQYLTPQHAYIYAILCRWLASGTRLVGNMQG